MNTTQELVKKPQGQRMVLVERNLLIAKMVDLLCDGYMSTYALSKKLKVARQTIDSYRPLVDEIIQKTKIDRNVIRNLQIQRTYKIIEQLMEDLTKQTDTKSRALIYNSIYKFSSHLALITGLNVETHVTVDPTKLVIIRSNKRKKEDQVDEQLLAAGKEIIEQT